ncbi:MAG: SDR family oxidoreductase [Anaerolineales bacterium]|jgi:NAD(P)-dependent dehydrogenase (short-subunit alcohol dehydrogenase family)
MKVVVITGSTRGIGFGLARELLRRDCGIVISGRKADRVGWAVAELAAEFGGNCIFGQPCDVTDFASVQALWDAAAKRFERIDIWINNAGISHRQIDLAAIPPEDLQAVVNTNILGTLYGASVAMRGMRGQGGGAIYNLEGLGSDGRHMRGLNLYGMTKYAVTYLTDGLAQEAKGSGVIVGAIRPGMVLTELITAQYTGRDEDWRRMQRVFRIIASDVKDVAPWVAERVLVNRRNGARIQYGKMLRILGRMITSRFGGRKTDQTP